MLNYKNLPVWKRSMDLAIAVNQVIQTFPASEKIDQGIGHHLLQAAIRIPARVAESNDPFSFLQSEMLQLARYHLAEAEFLLDIALVMGYLPKTEHERLMSDVLFVRQLINQHLQRKSCIELVTS